MTKPPDPRRQPDLFSGAELEKKTYRIQFLPDEPGERRPIVLPAGEAPPLDLPAAMMNVDLSKPSHSPDFETVVWNGQVFALTPTQRPIIQALWQAWEKGHPFLSGEGLLDLAGSEARKMFLVFRKPGGAWLKLISPGEFHGGPDGTYCLVPPLKPTPKSPSSEAQP